MAALEPPAGRSSSLVAGVRILRQRWWVVALCFLIGVAAAIALDARKTKQYESTATLQFGALSTNVNGVLNANAAGSSDPQREQSTTLLLITSSEVAERVRRALKLKDDAGSLAAQVTATAEADADLIDVTAKDPDPKRAAALANAFAQQYRVFRQDSDREGLTRGVQTLQEQFAATPETAATQRQQLLDAITQLNIQLATTTGGVRPIDRAVAAADPSSPKPKRDGILGGILGLALGAALVFALDLFDRRLRSVGDLEAAYGLTAMTSVPLQRDDPRDDRDRVAMLEPYRILRSGLSLLAPGETIQVVLVTSAVPGEGKSTTAAGLARAVAFSGARVALVEMDLRRPTFHTQFQLGSDHRGLMSALMDEASVNDLMRRTVPDYPTLQLLPAGGLPQRSAELLGGPDMTRVLDELRASFDMVILDAPPLLPVADTRALLDSADVDVCLVVGNVGLTARDEAARARTILEYHGVRHLGLVVNGVRGGATRYDYDGDYYGSDAVPAAPKGRAARRLAKDARPS